MRFADRRDAGAQLALALEKYRGERPVIVGLTRGGVPVAAEVARALGAPLDVCVVRKLGAPFQPELGLGAIAEGGGRFVDPELVIETNTTDDELRAIEARERAVMDDRIVRYRAVRPKLPLEERTVIVVDDGIATGGTARAALASIRGDRPRKVVLAIPVAAPSSLRDIAPLADEVVCVQERHLFAIGASYVDFSQTSDDDVVALLQESIAASRSKARAAPRAG